MIMRKTAEKIIIPLIGLISGILLFLGVFSISVEATVFSYDYHRASLKKLGITGLITDKIFESIEASGYSELFDSYIEEHVTEDLIIINIRSLVGGLLDYIKGTSDTLPYLYFNITDEFSDSPNTSSDNAEYFRNDIQLNTDEITASPLLSLSKIDKINLRLLVMFSDEENIDDVLKSASLLQYFNKNLMKLSIMLLFIISILILSQNKRSIHIVWSISTALCFSLLCISSSYIVTILLNEGQYRLEWIMNKTNADFIGFVKSYTTIAASSLVKHLYLSVIVILAILFIMLSRSKNHIGLLPAIKGKKTGSLAAAVILAVLAAALYLQITNAVSEYKQRDLEKAVLFLRGIKAYNNITDAKNHDVCFLQVSTDNRKTDEPVKSLVLNIYQKDNETGLFVKTAEDNAAKSSFLLEKGSYRLIIASTSAFPDEAVPGPELQAPSAAEPDLTFHAPAVYDFVLEHPGRTELNVVIDDQNDIAVQIKSASIQYIP